MSVFCVLINSLLLIKCPRSPYGVKVYESVKKYYHFADFGQVKNIVILLTLGNSKKYCHFADLGQVAPSKNA